MAQILTGLMSFPGINQIISGTYSLVHGVSPGVAEITIVPQLNFIGAGGDLVISFLDTTIVLPDTILDKHSFQRRLTGLIWRLRILDRRWKWRFPTISATYNLRDEGNNLNKDSEKTPRELATILLKKMGEANFKVDKLPNDSRPRVEWDVTNAANALATLCDSLGCRVVMHIDSSIEIEVVGVGKELPVGGFSIADNTGTIDPPERPGKLKVVGAITRFQTDFNLFPVGLDTDGKIKPIEELSYAPPVRIVGNNIVVGWPGNDPFYPFDEDFETTEVAELAKLSVFRWYRIIIDNHKFEIFDQNKATGVANLKLATIDAGKFGGGFNSGPWPTELERLDQILPIENVQVDTKKEGEVDVPRLAEIWGVWTDNQLGTLTNVSNDLLSYEQTKADFPDAFYSRNFTIDTKKGIIKFGEPLFSFLTDPETGDRVTVSARLALRVAVKFRDATTRAFVRYELERKIGQDVTKALVIRREEIRLGRKMFFNQMETLKQFAFTSDNQVDADKEANHYLDAKQKELAEISRPQEVGYNGIIPIEVDGAIQQVTWNVGPSGATTRASRNNEQENVITPYKVRRNAERLPADLLAIRAKVERFEAEEKLG